MEKRHSRKEAAVVYLESFRLASERDETHFLLNSRKLDMSCLDVNNAYPFKIFPFKYLERLDFAPITLLYGGNGSGKSTLLNIIAEKLRLRRTSPFNDTPCFGDYLGFCRAELGRDKCPPEGRCIITSDDVFDFMLSFRALNAGVDRKREELIDEWRGLRQGGLSDALPGGF